MIPSGSRREGKGLLKSTSPGPSNGIGDSGHENDDTLLSLEVLLFGAEEVPKSQRAGSSIEHGTGRSDDAFGSQPKNTATTFPLLEVEIGVAMLMTATTSTPEVTARLLSSKTGSSAPSALYRLRWQAQKLGTTLETPLADAHTDRWRLVRCSILHEKTEDSISDPPPLLTPSSRRHTIHKPA